MSNNCREFVNVKGNLGHQYGGGTSRNARLQRDPAGIPAHNLHDHHPVVAFCRCVQTIYGVGGNLHRRLKTKSGVGAHDVIVNSLWHTDNGQAVLFVKQRTNSKRTISTYNNQRIQQIVLERFTDSFDTIGGIEGPASTSAQNCAATGKNAAHGSCVKRHGPLFHHAVPSIHETNDLVAKP